MRDDPQRSTTARRRWTWFIAMAVLAWCATTAQAQQPTHGGTLTIGYHIQLAAGLDVMSTTNVRDDIAQMVFEPLMTFDENFEAAPILATAWATSTDQLTWTFELRQGATFHDGTPFTAADVAASFGRFMEMAQRRGEFSRVAGWRAIDAAAFEITLSTPWAALTEALAMPSGAFVVMPTRVAEAYPTSPIPIEVLADNVGTGPYRLVSVDREREYVFERFEDYVSPPGEPSGFAGARHAYVDRIVILPITDRSTRSAALFAGEVDLTTEHPAEDLARLNATASTQASPALPGLRVYLKLNLFDGPFTDPVLRRAVMAAIDHEMVMAAQGPNELWRVNPTPRFQQPQWMWDPIAFEYYPNDLELARYLVEQSDYDGRVIRFMHNTDWVNPMRTGPVVQELMRDIGLNVELITVDTATFFSLWTQFDQWDIKSSAGGSEVTTSYLDAASRTRNGLRWPGWPPEWDYYLGVVQTEADRDVRKDALRNLYRLSAEMGAEIYLGEVSVVYGARDYVRNVPTWPIPNFWNVWLDR